MTLALGSILWCLKCIDIRLTPIWTPLWGPGGPKVPKTEKFRALLWNHFRWKSLQTLCQFTSHFWNFVEFPYYWENWEYFSNFDFSNFKLQYSFFWKNFEWNFSVTHVLVFSDLSDPLGVMGVTKLQNTFGTKIPLEILPEIWISSIKISKFKIGKIFSVFSVMREFNKISSLDRYWA